MLRGGGNIDSSLCLGRQRREGGSRSHGLSRRDRREGFPPWCGRRGLHQGMARCQCLSCRKQ
eukprot:15462326-Alexandrium_andersonii.AAC.1